MCSSNCSRSDLKTEQVALRKQLLANYRTLVGRKQQALSKKNGASLVNNQVPKTNMSRILHQFLKANFVLGRPETADKARTNILRRNKRRMST